MGNDLAVRIMEIAQRKTNELFDEVLAALEDESHGGTADERSGTDVAVVPGDLAPEPWSLEGEVASGAWEEVARDLGGVSYTWPDSHIDRYDLYVSYRGTGGFHGINLALGYLPNGDVVGFHVGEGGGSKRGITYFFPADDFDRTNEKVSMIRGGGPRGRSGFAPGEALPRAYSGLRSDVLRDRVGGKWNVQAVVADADDHATMLLHTALQARLRKLI